MNVSKHLQEWVRIPVLILIMLGLSCRDKPTPAPFSTEELARFEGMKITKADLNALVLNLSAANRPSSNQDLDAWYRNQIREWFTAQKLEQQARSEKLFDDPLFLLTQRETRRRIIANQYLRGLTERQPKITQEDLEKAYQEHQAAFSHPERRLVFHLFRRTQTPEEQEKAIAELEGFRKRVLRGESFQKMASTYSDSESRHRGGNLGWLQQGTLEPVSEKVIFSIEEGVPSAPTPTPSGVHLFYVDSITKAKTFTLQEATPDLVERLRLERSRRFLDQEASKATVPDGSILLDPDGFKQIFSQTDPETVIFQLGDSKITKSEFFKNVAIFSPSFAPKNGSERVPLEKAWQAYDSFVKHALISHYCETEQLVDPAMVETSLAAWERSALIQGQRTKSLVRMAEKDENRLMRFYESNIGRFSTVPATYLRLLRIPLGKDPIQTMADLEQKVLQPEMTLDQLAIDGSTLTELGWKTVPELNLLQPKLPSLISQTETGNLTAPYRAGAFIEVVEVKERRDSEPMEFEKIKSQVAEVYAAQYTAMLYQQFQDTLVPMDQMEINEPGLAEFLQNDLLNKDDISVEELEQLLLELEEE